MKRGIDKMEKWVTEVDRVVSIKALSSSKTKKKILLRFVFASLFGILRTFDKLEVYYRI